MADGDVTELEKGSNRSRDYVWEVEVRQARLQSWKGRISIGCRGGTGGGQYGGLRGERRRRARTRKKGIKKGRLGGFSEWCVSPKQVKAGLNRLRRPGTVVSRSWPRHGHDAVNGEL
jgi:hypothetical protein